MARYKLIEILGLDLGLCVLDYNTGKMTRACRTNEEITGTAQ